MDVAHLVREAPAWLVALGVAWLVVRVELLTRATRTLAARVLLHGKLVAILTDGHRGDAEKHRAIPERVRELADVLHPTTQEAPR